ncbi:MAG: hypothetical protein JWM41_2896 [Gemmatimonadetes bacterium]|nr:hypothetical protein [Gemmatimonadota bacterium]
MSWGITQIGKPTEIAGKVTRALASSRHQSNHVGVFDAIESGVAAAVAGISDRTDYDTTFVERLILVETGGHIDGSSASVTLSIKTINDHQSKPAS